MAARRDLADGEVGVLDASGVCGELVA